MTSARAAGITALTLVGGAVAWGAAAGGERLVVVADEQQLRVSWISDDGTTAEGLSLRSVASRRTGVPIESVSVCQWNDEPHIALVVRDREDSVVRTYRLDGDRLERAFADLRIGYPVRKAEIADVDGDSVAELLVCVSKKSRRDPVVRLRPFVYTWSGVSWVPKWLGSRLGYDLVDFTCVPAEGGDRLLTLERRPDGEKVVTLYRWTGFGFRGIAEPAPGFAERIGGTSEVVWVWDGHRRVGLRRTESSLMAGRTSADTERPLLAVFVSNKRLYGFDGSAVVPIRVSGTGGES